MTKCLIENELATKQDINHVLYSSLTVPKDYVNLVIDDVYEKNDGYEQFIINCMIEMYKPARRVNYKSIAISTDRTVIF